ncbi:toprim domain-containing protein [Paenibacillus polymyxa]|uniref:Toprim domain-containing protein n=1 Tax=Paenibacillus polymyxa TaxID=1406 RepID=A0AAP3ZZ99_PAEPO|nr:toprim domain-containing protein [Paenibacillus polymyxa]MDH2332452.1 toprim domain-containing protein [Paenibacillus polymyxa]
MRDVNVDVFLSAVGSYDWRNVQPNNRGRLNASSPFGLRVDSTPSFSLITDPDSTAFGCWTDLGAKDSTWARGGPIQLYSYLRNITYEEAREELATGIVEDTGPPTLRVKLVPPEPPPKPKPIEISPYLTDEEIPYLTGRGISPEIQRMFDCVYDRTKNAVVMPWCSPDGTPINAKWRATWGKAFWYARGGAPVRDMIYGIHIVYARMIERVLLVESEIDAMYAWSCGVPAIAVGGSAFTDAKAELLRRSPVRELLIGTDNDEAGEKLRREVAEKMHGYCKVYDVYVPAPAKDINEVGDAAEVRALCNSAARRSIFSKLQLPVGKSRRIM